MLAGVQWYTHAQLCSQLGRPQPAAQHQFLTLKSTGGRLYAVEPGRTALQTLDRRILKDFCTTAFGTGKQSHYRVDRVELTITGDEESTLYTTWVDRRVELLGLCGPDQFCLDTEALGDSGAAPDFVETIRAAGNSQRTVLFESYSPAGLGLKPGIELNVVAGQLGQAMARAELHNETGGVP